MDARLSQALDAWITRTPDLVPCRCAVCGDRVDEDTAHAVDAAEARWLDIEEGALLCTIDLAALRADLRKLRLEEAIAIALDGTDDGVRAATRLLWGSRTAVVS